MAVELHFMGRCEGEACARHAEWVSQCDGTAIGVHVICVIGQSQRAQDRQALRCEGFVKLNHADVRKL